MKAKLLSLALILSTSVSAIADPAPPAAHVLGDEVAFESALRQRAATLRAPLEAAADAAVARRAAEQERSEAERAVLVSSDRRDALAYDTEVAHEKAVARRKTAAVLGAIALAFGGAGYGLWDWAESGKADIRSGGYATSMDIATAASDVKLRQQIGIGAFVTSAVFATIALGVVW